ncbi:MAG: NAD(P)/FAD-dependent oxidoreductase [Planctomycetes bacterium]|nr:NAD(P)/FAD-dependent oxidoreductase [Planctomycetota bacterium]
MEEKSVIIIGAGLAGLSAGCYAQLNGYKSRIFEHHSQPGGVAAAWKRKDYLIDGGIHFLMGHRSGTSTYEMYQELGIFPANPSAVSPIASGRTCNVIDMTTYCRFIDQKDNYKIDITGDLDRLAQELKTLSPEDSQMIDDLIAGVRSMQGFDMGKMGMDKPPELMTLWDMAKLFWGMRRVLKYYGGRYNKPVAEYVKYFHNHSIRRLLLNLFMPDVPVWFVLMLLALLADKQIGLIEGGSWDFTRALAKRYQELGGEISYNSTVDEILVADNKAVGVRLPAEASAQAGLAGGAEHRANVVLSAADGYSTIFKMLGGKYMGKKTEERYRTWKLFDPFVMVSFGVRREFKDEPPISIIIPKDQFMVGNHRVHTLSLRIFNYSDKFAPAGKTVLQAMFETRWHDWQDLPKDRPLYDTVKKKVADEVLKQLETLYPGVSNDVELTDVATPYTLWRYTRNYQGAFEGWVPTPEAIRTPIPRTLPGLSNFYMAGQWVMPGGGVPPCLYSGRQAIQLICAKDKRRFSSTQMNAD